MLSHTMSLCVPKQIYTAWYCSTFSKDRLYYESFYLSHVLLKELQ